MSTWGNGRASTWEHRKWARQVKQRDDYQCQRCGYQGTPGAGDVEADHITAITADGTNTLDNGITLCLPCHAPKSEAERLAGLRRRSAKRPQRPHPGLID